MTMFPLLRNLLIDLHLQKPGRVIVGGVSFFPENDTAADKCFPAFFQFESMIRFLYHETLP